MDNLKKIKSELEKSEEKEFIETTSILDEIDLSQFSISNFDVMHSTVPISAQGTVTINGTGSSGYVGSNNWYNPNIFSTQPQTLRVEGDADFRGDIKWQGRSLGALMETIEQRLSILVPDPEKLEHYEALQKAYNHYKVLEALCAKPIKKEEE